MATDKTGDVISVINQMVGDIDKRDAETAEMKRTVNRLCGYAKLPLRYTQIDEGNVGGGVRIQPGQFYRKPLATAVGTYLKMRGEPTKGGAGPATLDEIYAALKEGGFQFDAKNEMTAKRSLAIAIAKNSQTFEKLPTGQFGMRAWYQRQNDD